MSELAALDRRSNSRSARSVGRYKSAIPKRLHRAGRCRRSLVREVADSMTRFDLRSTFVADIATGRGLIAGIQWCAMESTRAPRHPVATRRDQVSDRRHPPTFEQLMDEGSAQRRSPIRDYRARRPRKHRLRSRVARFAHRSTATGNIVLGGRSSDGRRGGNVAAIAHHEFRKRFENAAADRPASMPSFFASTALAAAPLSPPI